MGCKRVLVSCYSDCLARLLRMLVLLLEGMLCGWAANPYMSDVEFGIQDFTVATWDILHVLGP